MKRILITSVALTVLAVSPAFAQRKATIQNVPEIPFSSVPNFLKLPPGEYLGEAVAVATNSKGHVFVFHRSANNRLFEFDQTGKFVKEIGSGYLGFEFAHSVRVDKDDNIWTVDEGSNMITKFSPEGRVLMVLGRRPLAVLGVLPAPPAGPNLPAQKYEFCRPTDVGWDPQGNIFVSDGYCNNRVVKYDKDGRFLAQAGSEKPGSALGEFNLPHGLQVDGQGNVWVADRTNYALPGARQQLEAPTGDYQRRCRLDRVCFRRPAPIRVLFEFESQREHARNAGTSPARSTRLSSTERCSASSATPAKLAPGFQVVHMIDCRNPNELIVGEIESWRVQKLILKPTSARAGGAREAAINLGEHHEHYLSDPDCHIRCGSACGASGARPEPGA